MQMRKERVTGLGRTAATVTPPRAPLSDGTRHANADDGLLDYEAAARYLCTTTRHVRELWTRRKLAAIKVGRSVRFTKADLDAFIAANRVRPIR
jgi:excisionase family DNA binding protein